MSAIQSSRHCSCASSEQAHGDRHSDVVSSSSVSSLKHIQHLRGSPSSSCCVVLACGASLGSSVTGCAASLDGELSNSVCESTDCAEKLFVRGGVCACCDEAEEEDDSVGGADLRCDAGCWGGSDAMMAERGRNVGVTKKRERTLSTNGAQVSVTLAVDRQRRAQPTQAVKQLLARQVHGVCQ
jgi:hypothetical protein